MKRLKGPLYKLSWLAPGRKAMQFLLPKKQRGNCDKYNMTNETLVFKFKNCREHRQRIKWTEKKISEYGYCLILMRVIWLKY